MNENQLVSVVTISYNQAEYLEECILSVLNQDYSNIEYIVVDPGSTDGSRDIIEKYRDRISYIVYEKDKGPADGLNKGFDRASGDIFCYLNSDDLLLDGTISKVVKRFSSSKDLDMLYGHGLVIDKDGEELRKCYSDKFDLIRAAYGASVVIQPSTFFKSKCFHKVGGFNINNKSNWDGELFIDMVLQGCKSNIFNELLSCYRVYDESITGSGKFEALHEAYHKMMFQKIMKRDYHNYDKYLSLYHRIIKHMSSPVAFKERLLRGPIFKAN